MKCASMGYVMVLLVYIALPASSWRQTDDNEGRSTEEKRMVDYLRDVKRTNWMAVLCGKWDDWCLPNARKPGLTCCDNYTCKCNLWNTNCRCKSKLFSGK